jgi:hypothetical protein
MHSQVEHLSVILQVGVEARIFGLDFDGFAVGKAGNVSDLLGQGFVLTIFS